MIDNVKKCTKNLIKLIKWFRYLIWERNLSKNQQLNNTTIMCEITTPNSSNGIVNRNRNSSTKKSQKKNGKNKNKQTPKNSLLSLPSGGVVIQTSAKNTIVTVPNDNNNVDTINKKIISTNDLTIEENDSDIELIEENVTVINLLEDSQDIFTKESSKISPPPSTSAAKSSLVNEISAEENNGTIIKEPIKNHPIVESNVVIIQSDTIICNNYTPEPNNIPNLNETITNDDNQNKSIVIDDVVATNQPLFFNDTIGGNNSLKIPLYDTISDTSFMFDDSTLTSTPNTTVIVKRSVPPVLRLAQSSTPINKSSKTNKRLDDSVVFVSETVLPSRNDFIPIAGKKKRGRNEAKSVTPPNKKKKQNRLPQKSNQNIKRIQSTQLQPAPIAYVCNLYNPNKNTEHTNPKRMIIIDGNNVAFGHSCNNEFSVRGIVICIEFFEREGHVVKAVLPQMRLKQRMSSDSGLLETLQKQGKILLTPCKNLPGQRSISYDDRFIMDLAVEFDAAVISNDNYKDLLDIPKYRDVILGRVVGYTWCNDMIMLPQDPYGRNGPSLSQILNRNVN